MSANNELGLSYPDVLLEWPDAWAALHVWLTGSELTRLPALLRAYGAQPRYRSVIFLVQLQRVAVAIERVAAGLGLADLVSVQWMEF